MYPFVMAVILWAGLKPLTAGCNLVRASYRVGHSVPMHGHDFAEVCWVESGQIREDTPRSHRLLATGDAILVSPGQHHALRQAGSGPATIVNLALSAGMLAELAARYDPAAWPWTPGDEPTRRHLEPGDLAELARRVDALRSGPGDRLAREAFLVDLADRLRSRGTSVVPGAPPWLAAALVRLAEPPLLAEGLPALARLCGRSREHVSRSLRAATGRRAIDLLTDLRLNWAERRLALSDDPVGTIAGACGFAGRARFHRLFRAHAGTTPLAYRRACRGAVGR